MQIFILLAVSVVILSGCDMSMGSLDLKGEGDGSNVCSIYYKAVVHVQYQNGDPCTTAFAKSDDFIMFNADSAGDLKIRISENCSENNYKIKSYPFVIYEEHHGKKIWEGDILLGKFNTYEGEWPDPFIEIVISN